MAATGWTTTLPAFWIAIMCHIKEAITKQETCHCIQGLCSQWQVCIPTLCSASPTHTSIPLKQPSSTEPAESACRSGRNARLVCLLRVVCDVICAQDVAIPAPPCKTKCAVLCFVSVNAMIPLMKTEDVFNPYLLGSTYFENNWIYK